jgi:hypothetical protein
MIPEALPTCASRKLELIIPVDLLDDLHQAACLGESPRRLKDPAS